MQTPEPPRRRLLGAIPHRHHRLIALVVLLILVLLALPLLGQHSHAGLAQTDQAQDQHEQATAPHCHDHGQPAPATTSADCHCLHACAATPPPLDSNAVAIIHPVPAVPEFLVAQTFRTSLAPAPPYRPPTATSRM